MDEFPLEVIEQVITAAINPSDEEAQSKANSFLCEWTNSPDVIPTSFMLLKSLDEKSNIKEIVSMILLNAIKQSWNSMSQELQNEIRQYFIDQQSQPNFNDNKISYIYNRIISVFLLIYFDVFAEKLFLKLITTDPNSPEFISNAILVLHFLSECNESQYIIEGFKDGLRDILKSYISQLNFMILQLCTLMFQQNLDKQFYFPTTYSQSDRLLSSTISVGDIGILILRNLANWCSISDILTPEILGFLVPTALYDSRTSAQTIECLSACLIYRFDVGPIFDDIYEPIIHAFAHLPQQSIQSIAFLTQFLDWYLLLFEKLLSPETEVSIQLHNIKLRLFHSDDEQILAKKSVSETFVTNLQAALQLTYLTEPDDIYEEAFWKLWGKIGKRIFKASQGSLTGDTCLLLIKPFLQDAILKLSSYLSLVVESEDSDSIPLSFFINLVRVYPKEYGELISSQPISPSMIYAMSYLCYAPKSFSFINDYCAKFPGLSSEFYPSILYFYSQVSYILHQSNFDGLLQLSLNCLTSGDELLQASASWALHRVFQNCPLKFNFEEMIPIFQSCLFQLCDDALVKVMELITLLLTLFQKDFTILIEPLLVLLENRTEVALSCLQEMASYTQQKCNFYFESIWPHLFELLGRDVGFLQSVYLAITASCCHIPFDTLEKYVTALLTMISIRFNSKNHFEEHVDYILDFLAEVRIYTREMDQFYPQIQELCHQIPASTSMMKIFQKYCPKYFDFDFVFQKILEGISTMSPHIVIGAFLASKTTISYLIFNHEVYGLPIVRAYRHLMIKTVVNCLFDPSYISSFSKQSNLLFKMFAASVKFIGTSERSVFSKELLDCLNQTGKEPFPSCFSLLVESLNLHLNEKVEFKFVLEDFLISMKTASFNDLKLFFIVHRLKYENSDDNEEEEEKDKNQEHQNSDDPLVDEINALTLA